MTKHNLLFGIIGLLIGAIAGFIFANSVNQRGLSSKTSAGQVAANGPAEGAMPSNAVADQTRGPMPPEVAAALQTAKSQPDNYEAQMQAGDLYYQIRRFQEAIQYWTRANQIKPNELEPLKKLGEANFYAANLPMAAKWYTSYLEKKPDDLDVRTDLGLTFLISQPPDIGRAISEFKTVLRSDSNHEHALQDLVVALTRKGEIKEAETTLEHLQKVNPSNPEIANLRSDIEKQSSQQK
jgi:tetratricopeptide (TPR) repeat protein